MPEARDEALPRPALLFQDKPEGAFANTGSSSVASLFGPWSHGWPAISPLAGIALRVVTGTSEGRDRYMHVPSLVMECCRLTGGADTCIIPALSWNAGD